MNCREGDLAIIVKSDAGNEGKIVICEKFLGKCKKLNTNGTITEEDCWKINIKINGWDGDKNNIMEDYKLRPIRDSDKQDEMLSIVNLKEKVKS